MNTKLLRQKVLDLAIHGKLVPQNPEHEPASVLLERIRKENPTKFTPISKDEIPFEIPENWAWCRLGEICDFGKCKVSSFNDFNPNSWILDLEDIEKDTGRIIKYVTFESRNSLSTKHAFLKGDLLYSKLRPYLNKVIIAPKDGFCTSEILPLYFNNVLINAFAQHLLMSPYFLDTVNLLTYGVKMPRLGSDQAKKIALPIPPLEEQKLIVAEIERIFALIDTVEQNKADLETVIKQTKSKILDLAIHGKLAPQDPSDEPASKMLEKLRAEKEAKIAAGEFKRDKNDSWIFKSDDGKWLEKKADGKVEEIEVPFEIPESWCWCRLPSVCRRNITDGTHNSPPTTDKGEFLYITAKNIKDDGIDLSNISFVSKEVHDVIYGRCPVEQNDVLLTKDGTIGEATVNNLDYPFSLLSSVALIKPSECVLPWYLVYVLKSEYLQTVMKQSSKGVALKRIILEQINQFLIPLPPLEEQEKLIFFIKKFFISLSLLYENK